MSINSTNSSSVFLTTFLSSPGVSSTVSIISVVSIISGSPGCSMISSDFVFSSLIGITNSTSGLNSSPIGCSFVVFLPSGVSISSIDSTTSSDVVSIVSIISSGNSIISSNTSVLISSVISSSPVAGISVIDSFRLGFFNIFFFVSASIFDSSFGRISSSGTSSVIGSSDGFRVIASSVSFDVTTIVSIISAAPWRRSIISSSGFDISSSLGLSKSIVGFDFDSSSIDSSIISAFSVFLPKAVQAFLRFDLLFLILHLKRSQFRKHIRQPLSTSSSGSSMISSVTVTVVSSLHAINSSVMIFVSSSGLVSKASGLDFRLMTFFFEVFFGLPSSGFSSGISSSGFCSSSGSSIISSVTMTVVSSVISFSSASCNSAVGSFGLVNFFTNFFFVSTPTSDSMSG
ncbi:hypothetical protein DERF_012720 [Dermatophagoides farinae]|uniref:Uncharacterized protein n=1 Tax=Dermatophagoides farinae TaxID=6954 RepID=A0A922HQN2_DERFA|nr:hypothetical protein DERF_012720 [Dermatophagoides farinae]